MVRVLRNGADDGGRQPASNLRLPQQQAQANPLTSVWNAGNQRLNEFGLQNFSVGGFEFQPMHLVAAVIAFFLIGPMGALLVIGMTVFQQYSSRESPQAVKLAPLRLDSPNPSQRRRTFLAEQDNDLEINKLDADMPFACDISIPAFHERRSLNCGQKRDASQLPPVISEVFSYAAESNITQTIQWAMEGIHSTGVPWAGTFVLSAVALRLATAPLHVYAEKLFAKRIHAQTFFTREIFKKVSAIYRVGVVEENKNVKLKTDNPDALAHADKVIKESVPAYLAEHKLQASRIQNLKICSVPVWLFSSFALRNIINGDFAPSVHGGLWIPDMLAPDPYFVLPVAVGFIGFLNMWSQRKIYPAASNNKLLIRTYDTGLAFMMAAAMYIMTQLPAVIPLYWLVASTTGFMQAHLLRHTKVKKLFDIKPLPTDSNTPLRDLFLLRKAV